MLFNYKLVIPVKQIPFSFRFYYLKLFLQLEMNFFGCNLIKFDRKVLYLELQIII